MNAEVLLVQFAPVWISQTQEMILEQMFQYFYCLAQRVVVQQACHYKVRCFLPVLNAS